MESYSDTARRAQIEPKFVGIPQAPAIIRLITQIASRFSIVVSEKAAAQAVPLVGAFGGAVVNTLFIDHFQDMGRGHFIVRRLERLHGREEVKRVYKELQAGP